MRGTWQTTGSSGGGAGQFALVVVAAVVAVALAGPVVGAVVSLVKALLIAVAAVVLLAATLGGLVLYLRRGRPHGLPVRTARELPGVVPRVIPAAQQAPAIENHYHNHFYGMTADDVAQAIARRQEES